MGNSTRGKFLIANSSIISDFFHNKVVFMLEHDNVGAFGLAINHKLDVTISELIKGVSASEIPVFSGGPVDSSYISILHNNPNFRDPGGMEVIPGVFMGRSFELLLNVMESKSQFRVFQGYSGWGSSQLEEEIESKSWVVTDAVVDLIFNEDLSSVWRESLKTKGGLYKYFAEHTKDPMLN